MLPKLKTLNEQAQRRSVAYILVTNLIGSLDEAAVREGRFDEKMGIYPPDVLSRPGRFVSQANLTEELEPLEDFEKRVLDVVEKTAGAPMQTLGKPGWFTNPKKVGKQGNRGKNDGIGYEWDKRTPFHYVFGKEKERDMDQPEPEAQIREVIGEGKTAIIEYVQWWWVNQWDKNVRDGGGGSNAARRIFKWEWVNKWVKNVMREVTETDAMAIFDQVIKQLPNASNIETLQNALNEWKQKKKDLEKK